MEFSCDATTFSTALAPLRACLGAPLLTGEIPLITLETRGADLVTCRASTTELEMLWTLEASIARPGHVSMPGLPLLAFTREAISGPLDFSTNHGHVTLHSGPSTLRLKACDQTIPRLNIPESPALATLPAGALERLLHRTAFCAGHDRSRPAITGILLRITGPRLTAVATDGTRLAEAMIRFGQGGTSNGVHHLPTNILLAPRSVRALETALHAFTADTLVELRERDKTAYLHGPSAHIGAKLLTGIYPHYEVVFAPPATHRLRVARVDLLQAIRQVNGLIEDETITLTLDDHTVTITGARDGDQARALLTASWDGPPTQLSCAPRALAEGLDMMDGTSVDLAITSPYAPIVCTTEDDPGYRYIVLPVASR